MIICHYCLHIWTDITWVLDIVLCIEQSYEKVNRSLACVFKMLDVIKIRIYKINVPSLPVSVENHL